MGDSDAALLQHRLASFLRITLLVSLLFWLAVNSAYSAEMGTFDPAFWLFNRINRGLNITMILFLAMWRICAGPQRPLSWLRSIDVLMAVVLPLASADATLEYDPARGMPAETSNLLLTATIFLTLRAALIPSPTRRTVIVTAAALVGPSIVAYMMYQRNPWLETQAMPFYKNAIWLGMVIVTAAIVSRVVFGLRQQVRAAMQLGQYQLQRKLGQGGMGEVYEASHAMLRRKTAIKLLPAGQDERDCARALRTRGPAHQRASRTRTPWRSTTMGAHPTASSTTRWNDSTGWISREWSSSKGPLAQERVVHICRQICGAPRRSPRRRADPPRHQTGQTSSLCQRGGMYDVAKGGRLRVGQTRRCSSR